MGEEFLQWLIGQSGMAGLAGFAMWMLKQSYEQRIEAVDSYRKDRAESSDRFHDDLRELHRETREALTSNTEAMMRLADELRQNRVLNGD